MIFSYLCFQTLILVSVQRFSMNILLLPAYLANHLFFWVAAISTTIHITTRPQLYTLLKAMHLQAKLISRVRTIYLLPWEKTGQTKKELSAFWGKKKRREELQRWEKKGRKKLQRWNVQCSYRKKSTWFCSIAFQLESWPQSTEMHKKTALSGIKCQWNY